MQCVYKNSTACRFQYHFFKTKENTALYTAYNKNDHLGRLKEVCLTVFFSRMNEMNTCYLQKVMSNVVQINVNRQDINCLGANVDD